MLAALAREQAVVERIVVVGEEDALAPVATLRHMMEQAGGDEAGDAGQSGPPEMGRWTRDARVVFEGAAGKFGKLGLA